MTYTSADSVAGTRGGWGVKDVSTGASDEVITELRLGVTTRMQEVVETSRFATGAQLHDRPRRLMSRLAEDRVSMWHASAAGPDATGRPGNVFTHAVRQESHVPLLRPIEYWRSESWLAPFGATEVTNARLPADLLLGYVVTRESVVAFIRADMERLYVLEWLLAAVAHALESGVTLALGVESPDEGAMWLGAISYLTSPAHARRISWVTFERAAMVSDLETGGVTIACIPREDVGALVAQAGHAGLVLDLSWSLDEDHATWQTPETSFPAAPEWQNAMLDVFALDSAETLAVLNRLDTIVWRLRDTDAGQVPLSWPLWMAMLADDRQVDERPTRVVACLAQAPASMTSSPEVQALLAEVLVDAAATEALLATPGLSDAVAAEIQLVRARAYLSDGWHTGAPASTLSPVVVLSLKDDSAQLVGQALADAVAKATSEPGEVLAAARLVTFVVSHDIDPPPDSDATERSPGQEAVETLLARLDDPNLAIDDADRAAARHDLLGAVGRPAALSSVALGDGGGPEVVGSPVATLRVAAPPDPPPVEARPLVIAPEEPGGPASMPQPGTPASAVSTIDLVSALERMLEAADAGSERSVAIGDCLLVVHGLGNVPLREGFPGIEMARETAERLLVDKGRERLHDSLSRWLVVYWALAELGRTEAGVGPKSVPPHMLRDLDPGEPERMLHELTAFLQDANTSIELAATFVSHAKRRDLPPDKSVLGLPYGQARTMGWAAVERAFMTMDPVRGKAIKAVQLSPGSGGRASMTKGRRG
jgi:hypothetical protein